MKFDVIIFKHERENLNEPSKLLIHLMLAPCLPTYRFYLVEESKRRTLIKIGMINFIMCKSE